MPTYLTWKLNSRLVARYTVAVTVQMTLLIANDQYAPRIKRNIATISKSMVWIPINMTISNCSLLLLST